MVICLERGADLHMAQLMPLPLTVSCFSKIQTGFTFLVLAHPGSLGKRAVKRVLLLLYLWYVKKVGYSSLQLASPLWQMPYGITQCYLPPDRADISALTPSRTRYSIKWPRKDARLSWPSGLVTYRDGIPTCRWLPIPVLTRFEVG